MVSSAFIGVHQRPFVFFSRSEGGVLRGGDRVSRQKVTSESPSCARMHKAEPYATKKESGRDALWHRGRVGFRRKDAGRSHLEAQADHGDKIVEDFAIFHTAARRGNDFCGELGNVVAEFGAQEDLF